MHRMGVLRVTNWQKGVLFCLTDVSVQLMAQKWPTVPPVASNSERWPLRTVQLRHHVTRAEIPGSDPVTRYLGIPWNVEGPLGIAQRQYLGSCTSIQIERERSESDREEGWGIRLTILTILWGGGARGQWSLLCFNHSVPDGVLGSCLAWGWCPCGLIRSVSPLSSHGSLHVAGALMAFKWLTHAHTILGGLVLSWKEDKGETLTPPGSSYWGTVSSGAFGTHPRVTLARVPQLLT